MSDSFRLGPCPTRLFCDFESPDICNYVNDVSGNFNWTRHKGKTDSFETGPPYDHTTFTSEGNGNARKIDLAVCHRFFSRL